MYDHTQQNHPLKNLLPRTTVVVFCMWDACERKGFEEIVGYRLKSSLFLNTGREKKVSIWYGCKEWKHIEGLVQEKITTSNFSEALKQTLKEYWKSLEPYLVDKQSLSSIDGFIKYIDALVGWWSAMDLIMLTSGIADISEGIKNDLYQCRMHYEHYTDDMHRVVEHYWMDTFPQHGHIYPYSTEHEMVALAREQDVEQIINQASLRKEGYGLLKSHVY